VLNSFAGLCPPCRAEIPGFQAVNKRFGDEVIVLGGMWAPSQIWEAMETASAS
jgi:thiol-disulfide isomerase/thioredoxin